MIERSEIRLPATADEWHETSRQTRVALWRLLGDLPAPRTPQAQIVSRESRDGYTLEKIVFPNLLGDTVYGYMLVPGTGSGPFPAVLYQHAHGGDYERGKDELFHPGTIGRPPGEALVRQGYAVLAIDAYAFGERQRQGPAGERETGRETEWSLFKHFLWQGKNLWGMMVHDDLLALEYLLTRPEVDASRVGVTGMSMGGSRATWLAALDERVRVVIPVCQMTRYADLAAHGDYACHSFYYYVPGILGHGLDMELIASLAAPRAQLVLVGDQDPLSPIEGVHTIAGFARHVYDLYDAGDRYALMVYEGIGHRYTPEMFDVVLDWLQRQL